MRNEYLPPREQRTPAERVVLAYGELKYRGQLGGLRRFGSLDNGSFELNSDTYEEFVSLFGDRNHPAITSGGTPQIRTIIQLDRAMLGFAEELEKKLDQSRSSEGL